MGRSTPSRGRRKRGAEMANEETAEHKEPIPDMHPWLHVGWIFRDGDARAIERRGNRTRPHKAPGRDE